MLVAARNDDRHHRTANLNPICHREQQRYDKAGAFLFISYQNGEKRHVPSKIIASFAYQSPSLQILKILITVS